MPYTVFSYLYRDAANYKIHGHLWLEGALSAEERARFQALLEDGEFFIAEQVGVPALQAEPLGADDHVWHEFAGFEQKDKLPRGEIMHGSCREFIGRFEAVANVWRIEAAAAYCTC